MIERLPVIVFALVMAAIPFIPGMPPFWIVLLDNIGLSALVAMGLVLLTGVGGLTSFGQAAFCGFGAYTTAVLTTAYGVSPWLALPASLLVSGIAAVLLGLVTVRLSGHYLPLGTIAWGLGLFYLFSKLEFLGRNDGISGIPPLSIGSFRMIDPGAIYFAIWTAVLVCALLTTNLPDLFAGAGQLETIVFGILLVVLLQLAPAGVWPWLTARLPLKSNRKRPDTSLTLPASHKAPAAAGVLLRIDQARKRFGGVIAVNNVSFEGRTGELLALIGPNRAAKSTTFNLITRVLTSSA